MMSTFSGLSAAFESSARQSALVNRSLCTSVDDRWPLGVQKADRLSDLGADSQFVPRRQASSAG
jgi:hypothetical protein